MTDTPASLDALGIKPVAWIYKRHHFDEPLLRTIAELHRLPIGATETPLYSADDLAPLARRVEELEAALRAYTLMLEDPEYDLGEMVEEFANIARAALKENTDATSD